MNDDFPWGLIGRARWDSDSSSRLLLIAQRWNLRNVCLPDDYASGRSELFRWKERSGKISMEMGRQFTTVPRSLEEEFQSIRYRRNPTANQGSEIERVEFAIQRLLNVLQFLVDTNQPVGLLSPAGIYLVSTNSTANSEAEASHTSHKHGEIVLADLGLVFDGPRSSSASCFHSGGKFAHLWDHAPEKQNKAILNSSEVSRIVARMIASQLTGVPIKWLPAEGSQLAANFGEIWRVLCCGFSGNYNNLVEFRNALDKANIRTHEFAKDFSLSDLKSSSKNSRSLLWNMVRKSLLPMVAIAIVPLLLIAWSQLPIARFQIPNSTVDVDKELKISHHESKGQLSVQWDKDQPYLEIDGMANVELSHVYHVAGPHKISIRAFSKILGFIPVVNETSREVIVEQINHSVASAYGGYGQQFLRLEILKRPEERQPQLPVHLRVRIRSHPKGQVSGLFSVGLQRIPLATGESATLKIYSPGYYVITWKPVPNEWLHGESQSLEISDPSKPILGDAPVASLDFMPRVPNQGELVVIDCSASYSPIRSRISSLEVRFGNEDWEPIANYRSYRVFDQPGDYDVSIRVTDEMGLSSQFSRRLVVVPEADREHTQTHSPGYTATWVATERPSNATVDGVSNSLDSRSANAFGDRLSRPKNRFSDEPLPSITNESRQKQSGSITLKSGQIEKNGELLHYVEASIQGYSHDQSKIEYTRWEIDGKPIDSEEPFRLYIRKNGEFEIGFYATIQGRQVQEKARLTISTTAILIP